MTKQETVKGKRNPTLASSKGGQCRIKGGPPFRRKRKKKKTGLQHPPDRGNVFVKGKTAEQGDKRKPPVAPKEKGRKKVH